MTTPMHCNVILTFETPAGIYMDTQEIFDLTLVRTQFQGHLIA